MNMRIRHLNIEVTKRCNQRCFYCFNNSGVGSPSSELAPDRWLNVLGKLKAQGLESIHLTGGEPFAYPWAVELLAGAQAFGLGTSILSNGFCVRELATACPEVFRKLKVAQISLDSMNEQTHNGRRGYPRAWQDAMNAIQALRELDVPIEVSCVVSDQNLQDMSMVARFCVQNGISLLLRPVVPIGRAINQAPSNGFHERFTACLHMLAELPRLALVSDRYHYVPEESGHDKAVPTDIATVLSDGSLRTNQKYEVAASMSA